VENISDLKEKKKKIKEQVEPQLGYSRSRHKALSFN